jgi:shikimate 5-dehydrogenase
MQDESFDLDIEDLSHVQLVMDVVSKITPLLKMANKAGCITISGKELFIAQALLQYNQWFYQ